VRREVRLLYHTWTLRIIAAWDALVLAYQRRTCPHSYRPARVKDSPARVCQLCDTTQELTIEEFYAEFGERGMGMLK
jgi:hypothetical protein